MNSYGKQAHTLSLGTKSVSTYYSMKVKRPNRYAVFYKIICQCYVNCNFCREYEFRKKNYPPLTLEEVKKNYFYFKNKYKNIDYIILSGGEPTLHPQFFEMLDFAKKEGVGFRFDTNLIKFNEKEFFEKLKSYFSDFKTKKQEKLTKIIVSINDLPSFSKIARLRARGLIKAVKARLPLIVSTVIYGENVKFIPRLVIYIRNLFQKYAMDIPLRIDFRLVYLDGPHPALLKKALPLNFLELKKKVEEAINLINPPIDEVNLWNFPLCYLDSFGRTKYKKYEGSQRRRQKFKYICIKVHHKAQFDRAEIRDQEKLKLHQICRKCCLRNFCSGIDKEYIQNYGYPPLTPL